VEVLVVEVADGTNGRNEMYHVLYDGSIEDERNYAAMGGQAEEIRRFLKDQYREGQALADAVRVGIRALTVTQNKTLTDRDLEVAVLDQKRSRRKFRRVANGELRAILGRPDPPEGGRPMGTS